MSKAIIYIASGQQYIDEAFRSAQSISGEYKIILCTPDELDIERTLFLQLVFDILFLPKLNTGYWYLDLVYYLNIAFDRLYPSIRQYLKLDTDTYVCGDLEDFFAIFVRNKVIEFNLHSIIPYPQP